MEKIAEFWKGFLASDPATGDKTQSPCEAWSFGDTAEMADNLGRLVLAGVKTATCSLLWEYEYDKENIPAAGERSIITDGKGHPLCVIETVEVEIKPYCEVDDIFAWSEGEGDRSLRHWREAHWRFFTKVCRRIGREVDENMPLVCERFQMIYRPQL
jgi:uncharacterized protein YhfF